MPHFPIVLNPKMPAAKEKQRRFSGIATLFAKELERSHILQLEQEREVDELKYDDEVVAFNVSGKKFMTFSSTLNNFPGSIFGSKEKRDKLLRTKDGEIFLNRNAKVFKRVLTFCQTGIFEWPEKMNQSIFLDDVSFYNLHKEAGECRIKGFSTEIRQMPKQKWRAKLWSILEYPDSSLSARIFSLASISVILMSVVVFCWETIPSYKETLKDPDTDHNVFSFTRPLDQAEFFCIVWFTLELILRFLICPNKLKFIRSWLNIVDLVSILPFFVSTFGPLDGQVSIYFLRAIRLVRVFRVFKLSRHSMEMKVLGIAVRDSARELGVLVFFILLGVIIFSSAIYYAEESNGNSTIQSIPGAFWWSIVTMTTVGYGDVVPITITGRLVGALCGMSGILVIALPIPIIVNNFTRQYQRLKPTSKYLDKIRKRNERTRSYKVTGLFSLQDLRQTKSASSLQSSECNTHVDKQNIQDGASCPNGIHLELTDGLKSARRWSAQETGNILSAVNHRPLVQAHSC